MKITKTLAALCVLGAGLTAFSCKDNSGDGDTAALVAGIAAKYAISMTLDATGNNIKVGDTAIINSNTGAEEKIVDDTKAGKSTNINHELERQRCGKRFFKEISGGFNNTEGFRTNVVLNTAEGAWRNSDTGRVASAGMIFDFNKYGDKYDFFSISFKPIYDATGTTITSVNCYLDRYSGVQKYKEGIYSGHAEASCLGSNYKATNTIGSWDSTLYTPAQGETWTQTLTQGNGGYYLDSNGNIVIGLDVKQLVDGELAENGIYTIRIGKITYTDAAGNDQTFVSSNEKKSKVASFNTAWKTKFTNRQNIAKGGERGTSSIAGYSNWTHVKTGDKNSNLKGGVMVYGFAPYGTKPVAGYYTCATKLSSGTGDNTSSAYDYVGDWNIPNEIDTRAGVKDVFIYEEGGVVHEYVEY